MANGKWQMAEGAGAAHCFVDFEFPGFRLSDFWPGTQSAELSTVK
jgi:hypothetical protein